LSFVYAWILYFSSVTSRLLHPSLLAYAMGHATAFSVNAAFAKLLHLQKFASHGF